MGEKENALSADTHLCRGHTLFQHLGVVLAQEAVEKPLEGHGTLQE